ncbi:gibberellin 2-beta-dioxygenase 2-like [Bidens hawaiensis]|uniref:gibberellin 2-beta-dioxygenase 2-like n=1 Tax=Bidens hawaiensis TaxID=980011 RepID=UPI00404ACECF
MVVATQEMKIPTIDLSGKESHVSKVIVEACEEYGFFKVINHGVPHHIVRTMEHEGFEFFQKPLPEKQRVGSANPFGYGNKNIGLSGDQGELEYLLQTNQISLHNTSKLISNASSKLSYTVVGYVEAVRRLACEILGLMAKGLGPGLPNSYFAALLTDCHSDSLFRLNHYPPMRHRGSAIGFGEHSDPQILTLLTSNDVPGLRISLPNGRWLPVTPDPLAFYVIVGDLLQVMTNGRFRSVRHRAMANTSSTEPRLSMAFFGGPPPETTISCPPQLLKLNKPLYKAFTWAEYKSHTYAHRLGDTRLNHFKLP